MNRAKNELHELQSSAKLTGNDAPIAPWDLPYYTEKIRKSTHGLGETAVQPFLRLDNMIQDAFWVAEKLFGLKFIPLAEVPVYHPDVRVWEVRRDDHYVGLFLGDYFARPSKSSGAWTGTYRDQHRLCGHVKPIIVNVLNLATPTNNQK